MDTKLILLLALAFAAVVIVDAQPKRSDPPKKPPATKKAPCKSDDTPEQCKAKVKKLKDSQDRKHLELYNEWIQKMTSAHKSSWKTVFPQDAKTYAALTKKFG